MAAIVPIYYNDNIRVYKNKKLNNADIRVSPTTYLVFLHLITKVTGVDLQTGEYLEPKNLVRQHVLTATEFSEVFNIDRDNAYKVLNNATKQLMKSSIKVLRPEFEAGEYWDVNICSMAKYKPKQGLIEIEFTDRLMLYLAQVKEKFVTYPLKDIINFKSFYSTRLYEIIMDFKDTGWCIKTIDQLREIFAVGKKHLQYRDLKRNIILAAINEINRHYDMELDYEETKSYMKDPKSGRTVLRVTSIKFTYKPTQILKKVDPKSGIIRNIYLKPKKISTASKVKKRGPKILPPELDLDISGDIELTRQKYLSLKEKDKEEISFQVLDLVNASNPSTAMLNKFVINLPNYSIALYAIHKKLPFNEELIAEIKQFLKLKQKLSTASKVKKSYN